MNVTNVLHWSAENLPEKEVPNTPEKTTNIGSENVDSIIPIANTEIAEETTKTIRPSINVQEPNKDEPRLPYGEIPDIQTLTGPDVETNTRIYDILEKDAIDKFTEHTITSIV